MALLDSYGSAVVAVSTRLLRNAYLGSCIRVRRSSDNTLTDIGFSSGYLDQTALLAFVGSGSGFIHTWYDQSGNGRDMVQAATGNQPRIVNSGVVETFTGDASDAVSRPAIRFGFSGASYLSCGIGGTSAVVTSSSVVKKVSAATGFGTVSGLATSYTTLGNYLLNVIDFGSSLVGAIAIDATGATLAVQLNDLFCLSSVINTTSSYVSAYRNGSKYQRVTKSASAIDSTTCLVGAWSGNFMSACMSEHVMWTTDRSSDVFGISGSQCSSFGIAIPTSPSSGTSGFTGLSGAGRLGT